MKRFNFNAKNIYLYTAVFLLVFLPRIFQLDKFVTSDEHLWLTASGNFYYALAQREFEETYRFEAPAVTSTWAGVMGYLLEIPEYRGWGQGYMPREKTERLFERHQASPIDVLAAGRIFVVLQVSAVMVVVFAYTRRFLPTLAACAAVLIAAFDPFFMGLTRILHMDGLLAVYMLLCVLAYLSYFYRGRRRMDLVVSGAAFGLSLLSKSPGAFLLPFLGLLTGLAAFRQQAIKPIGVFWKDYIRPFLMTVGAGALTFTILWPAMWVSPLEVVNKVFIWAFRFASGGHDTAVFFDGKVFIDSGFGAGLLDYYPVTFLWRTTPPVLIGLALAIGIAWAKGRSSAPAKEEAPLYLLVDLALFAFLFMVFMTIGGKKFDRYLIPAYLPLDMIAGMGWAMAAVRFGERKGYSLYGQLLAGVICLAQAVLAMAHFPYYLTYFNPLLGGPAGAPQVMQIGWGEGLDQAAAYLSEKPNAKNLTVLSWYGEGCFSYFFPGNTRSIWIQQDWQRANARSLLDADYIVIYIHQGQRQMTDVLLEVLDDVQPEYVVELKGLPYAKIFAVSDISEADMDRLLAPVPNRSAP